MTPRWSKLWRDVRAERSRYALMLLAIVVSVAAFGTVLGARDVLQREMARNYLGSNPAHATLELPDGVDAAALALARSDPSVETAEAGDVLPARVRVGEEWRSLLLFVVDDFQAFRLSRFEPKQGAFPPPPGQALIERTAAGVLAADTGGRLEVLLPGSPPRTLVVAGAVHDASLAPAWQEQAGYAYIDSATLRANWPGRKPHELRVRWRDTAETLAAIQARGEGLAARLRQAGHRVDELRVPPPRRHPHQRQMETVLLLLLSFAALALVLSALLVANALAALLARQTREIAVLKTLGARTGQLVLMQATLVGAMGLLAWLVGMPLARFAAGAFAGAVANLLNLSLASDHPAGWVFGLQGLAALAVPLGMAALPIARACRTSIRAAMDQRGIAGMGIRRRSARWPATLRSVVRRPARLALTVALLAGGGAMFMTALNVARSWELTIDKVYATRRYDVEVRAAQPLPASAVAPVVRQPGVRAVETWGFAEAAFARPQGIDVSHAYPDRGHGAFAVMGVPPSTAMVAFPVLQGHWLRAEDAADAVVLNHAALAQRPQLRLGDAVPLSFGGQTSTWRLVGVVEEIGAAGVAYVARNAFAAAAAGSDARVLRVVTDAAGPMQRNGRIHAIDEALLAAGAAVQSARPLSELRTAMGDHIVILIRALVAMAVVMAAVGGLGLTANMSVSVVERRRELAVMKTLGATPARLVRLVQREAQLIAGVGAAVAVALSLPLTAALDALVGSLGFVAPLPFAVDPAGVLAWALSSAVLAGLAAWWPARSAGRVSVAQALQAV
jgi:putative ABC transport system permease protein